MDAKVEAELLTEIVQLKEQRSPFLDESWSQTPVARYTDSQRFEHERERIHSLSPRIVAHVSALAKPDDFITLRVSGRPVLICRNKSGELKAFFNVCRHRGAELVADSDGCQKRFSCPYHAWTWNNDGELIALPHQKSGFPGLERDDFGLKTIACEEHAGWIWLSLAHESAPFVADYLDGLDKDLSALNAADYEVFDTTDLDLAANWKLLVEGGIESYHFRVAHRNTIAPLFEDNLSTYRCFGPHIRSVLARSNLTEVSDNSSLLQHANVLYSLFPNTQFLVQEDHFIWIRAEALAADRTKMQLSTMIPRQQNTDQKRSYWQKNHQLTVKTLIEDFELAEGIQRGLTSGANEALNFGRFEGALEKFNAIVEQRLA